jgi:hypothetical protein
MLRRSAQKRPPLPDSPVADAGGPGKVVQYVVVDYARYEADFRYIVKRKMAPEHTHR